MMGAFHDVNTDYIFDHNVIYKINILFEMSYKYANFSHEVYVELKKGSIVH